MGIIGWLSRRVGQDLDEEVRGSHGAAQGEFPNLVEGVPLHIQTRLSGGSGMVTVDARSEKAGTRRAEGSDAAALILEGADNWGGGTVETAAQVSRSPGQNAEALAVLSLELRQDDPQLSHGAPLSLQTYSVESRFDETGAARLQLSIRLGTR